MKLVGDNLLATLRSTGALVKLLSPEGDRLGRLTAAQAYAMVQADVDGYIGGGSIHRVRYIKLVVKLHLPTADQESFRKAHGLSRYDPTFFRTFAPFHKDQRTGRGKPPS